MDFSREPLSEDALWPALSALPERQRAVLVLRLYEGLADDEIADVMGTRESIVRSLGSLGSARLQRVVTDWAR